MSNKLVKAEEVALQQTEQASVPQTAGKVFMTADPFEQPEVIEGIVHKVGNPLQIICDCSGKGGFCFELNPKSFEEELTDFILLRVQKLDETWLFPKTYKRPQNWVIIFGVAIIDGKKYFVQMLMKGESRDNLASLTFKLQQDGVRLIDTKLVLRMKDKTSAKGDGYKIVEFKPSKLDNEALKSEIYNFVMENGGLDEVCKSQFFENIKLNAPILEGVDNPLFEGEMPKIEIRLIGRVRAEGQN